MKSLVEEASTVAKALEKAWTRAGKPQEFSVKVFEEQETNFLGFTKKSAKVGIFFEEPQTPRSHYGSSDNRSSRQGQNRRPNPNARPVAHREPRESKNDAREPREVRHEKPERTERPERQERVEPRVAHAKPVHPRQEEIRQTVQEPITIASEQMHNAAPRPQRQERPAQPRTNNRRPQNNNYKQRDAIRREEPTQQVAQDVIAQPVQHTAPARHVAPQNHTPAQQPHYEVRQDVRPEGHIEHHDPRANMQVSAKAPAHNVEHESPKHSTQPAPAVRKVLKVSTRCYSHPKKNDGSKP